MVVRKHLGQVIVLDRYSKTEELTSNNEILNHKKIKYWKSVKYMDKLYYWDVNVRWKDAVISLGGFGVNNVTKLWNSFAIVIN